MTENNWQLLLNTLTENLGKSFKMKSRDVGVVMNEVSSRKAVRNVLLQYIQEYEDNYKKKTGKDHELFEKKFCEALKTLKSENNRLGKEQLVEAQMFAKTEAKYLKDLINRTFPVIQPEFPLPDLERNESFPCASNKLRVETSIEKGRHVICAEKVARGDLLFLETPEAFIVNKDFRLKFCHHCGKRVQSAIVPCPNCNEVLYCTENCRDDAVPVHEYECEYLTFLQSVGVAHLALRCLIAKPDENDPEKVRRYQDLFNLQMFHIDFVTDKDMFQYAVTALLISTYLEKCTNFFMKNQHITKEEAGELLLRHILQLIVNAHAVVYPYSVPDHFVSSVSSLRVATGIFPSSAMMNHSCLPNIIMNFHGSTLVVRAAKDFEPGEEVLNCYGPHSARMQREERQDALQRQYNFQCNCQACSMVIDPMEKYIAFKCPKCSGPLTFEENGSSLGICGLCEGKTPLYHDMLTVFENSTKLLNKALRTEEVSIMALIKAWKNCQHVLFYCHDTTCRLADEIARRFAVAGLWKQCLVVLKPCLLILRQRYGNYHPIVVSEILKVSRVAAAAARQESNKDMAKKYLEESKLFEEECKDLSMIIYGCPEVLDDIEI